MTKLEEEMVMAINGFIPPEDDSNMTPLNRTYKKVMLQEAKAAAEVAKRYIKKAINDGFEAAKYTNKLSKFVQDEWLKENGII